MRKKGARSLIESLEHHIHSAQYEPLAVNLLLSSKEGLALDSPVLQGDYCLLKSESLRGKHYCHKSCRLDSGG